MPKKIRIDGISYYASDGRVFEGEVIAENIPDQFSRSRILAEAQEFADLYHAGLIVID